MRDSPLDVNLTHLTRRWKQRVVAIADGVRRITPASARTASGRRIGPCRHGSAAGDPDEGVTIEDVSVVEGDNGTKTVVIKVKLSAPSAQPVTIDWSTADPAPKR